MNSLNQLLNTNRPPQKMLASVLGCIYLIKPYILSVEKFSCSKEFGETSFMKSLLKCSVYPEGATFYKMYDCWSQKIANAINKT